MTRHSSRIRVKGNAQEEYKEKAALALAAARQG
jgi:hypothetical protein